MGPLGMLLLLGGVGAVILGIGGIVVNLWMLHPADALLSSGILVGGLIAGTVGTAILE